MKFFLDTANVKQIKEAAGWGILDGVTTNPSLVSKENAKFEEKLRKKIGSMAPMFFGGLWFGPHAEKLGEIRESTRRFVSGLFDLRVALSENLTEQALEEVEKFLNETSEKIEELSERLKRR